MCMRRLRIYYNLFEIVDFKSTKFIPFLTSNNLKNLLIKKIHVTEAAKNNFLLKMLLLHFCQNTYSSENQMMAFGSKFLYNIESKNLMKIYLILIGNMPSFLMGDIFQTFQCNYARNGLDSIIL